MKKAKHLCQDCGTKSFHFLQGQKPYETLKDGSILCYPCSWQRKVKKS